MRQFFNRCLGNRPASQGSCAVARRRRDLGRQDIEEFLAALARQEGVADWQAIQAREALEVCKEAGRGNRELDRAR